MVTNEELSTKLDVIIKNQEELKALGVLALKALVYLVQHEKGPDEFIQNVLADVLTDGMMNRNKSNTF
nr:MAG TPA: hypothetical protein [Caudoviricetes sp.]